MDLRTTPTPPSGVSEAALTTALSRFAAEVGTEHVLTGADVSGHLDPYAFADGVGSTPSAAVLPASVEQVQAVVRIADELRIPVWTVSRGRNYGYGGASPRVPGSVVIDLSRMRPCSRSTRRPGTPSSSRA